MVLSILEAVQDLHREDLEGVERPDGPQGLQRPEGFPQEAAHHRCGGAPPRMSTTAEAMRLLL